jgi:hypothetical protein
MKKNLLTILLMLCAPLISLSQVQSEKPKPQLAGQKARQPKKVLSADETMAEAKIGQPKRVSMGAFIELLDKGRKMVENGDLDLNSPIEMEVSADRSPTGVLSNIGINQKTIVGPQRELAREFIEVISSSGALEFLEGVKHIVFTLKLDQSSLSLSASSEMSSAKKAVQFAQATNLLLETGATIKRGRDEEVLYKGANISSSAKRVTITLNLPRATVADLLSKQAQSSSGQ